METQSASLRGFLDWTARSGGALTYHQVQGFLFSVASAPELIRPSEWLPVIFGDHEPEYESLDRAKEILGQLMGLYNDINAGVVEERPGLPDDCEIRARPLDNLDATAPLSRWARGFVLGHQWLRELWDDELPDDMDEELGAVLMILSFFASRRLAEDYHRETGRSGSLEDLAESVLRLLPEAMGEYAHFGRSMLGAAGPEAGRAPIRTARIGRNDPCPCGSGKKYKRCCGS